MDEVDIAPALSAAALAIKDENELVSSLTRPELGKADSGYSAPCEMPRKHASP